jgi:hypothetical protein
MRRQARENRTPVLAFREPQAPVHPPPFRGTPVEPLWRAVRAFFDN